MGDQRARRVMQLQWTESTGQGRAGRQQQAEMGDEEVRGKTGVGKETTRGDALVTYLVRLCGKCESTYADCGRLRGSRQGRRTRYRAMVLVVSARYGVKREGGRFEVEERRRQKDDNN